MNRVLLVVAVIGLIFAAGCGADDDGSELAAAEQALSSVELAGVESAIVAAVVEGLDAVMSPEDMAAFASAAADEVFQLPACVTTQTGGATVTYTLVDCTGPYGLVQVNGSFDVTFSVRLNRVSVAVRGSVTANQVATDLDLEATYAVAGTTNTLEMSTSSTTTGPRGGSINQSGTYTATWETGASCLALDGEWSVEIGSRTWTLSVSGFEYCAGSCPVGSIEYYGGIRDVTITLTFDGSDQVQWSSSGGGGGTIQMFCG